MKEESYAIKEFRAYYKGGMLFYYIEYLDLVSGADMVMSIPAHELEPKIEQNVSILANKVLDSVGAEER